jgi:hypothetical protein
MAGGIGVDASLLLEVLKTLSIREWKRWWRWRGVVEIRGVSV